MEENALIIGATGGIGAALTAELKARGARVAGVSRRDGFDFGNPASVAETMAGLTGPYHRIVVATGILAPNGQSPEKALSAIDSEAMAQVMAVNAVGPALVLREMPRLLPREGRSVTAVLTARVGSIGDNKLGGWYSYRASKAAANQIVHTAAIEIGRKFREAVVVALHPGTVATDFTQSYPSHKKQSAADAAAHLIDVMDNLSPAQSGGFFDWAGESVPW